MEKITVKTPGITPGDIEKNALGGGPSLFSGKAIANIEEIKEQAAKFFKINKEDLTAGQLADFRKK